MPDWLDDMNHDLRGWIGSTLLRWACRVDERTAHWIKQHRDAGEVMGQFIHGEIDAEECVRRGYESFY